MAIRTIPPTARLDDVIAVVNQLAALANELKADFNAHTHNADGAQAGAYYTSPPRTNAATVTAGTASSVAATDADTLAYQGGGTPI